MRLQRGLGGRQLACGCLTGVYETYEGQILQIVDAVSEACTDPAHRPGAHLPAGEIAEDDPRTNAVDARPDDPVDRRNR